MLHIKLLNHQQVVNIQCDSMSLNRENSIKSNQLTVLTFLHFHIFTATEAEFVAQIHSHLCDTANKRKQHYGEHNITSPPKTHTHIHTQRSSMSLCHNFSSLSPFPTDSVCVVTHQRRAAAPLLPSHALLLKKNIRQSKTTQMTSFTNAQCKISINPTGNGFVLLSRPGFSILDVCLFL